MSGLQVNGQSALESNDTEEKLSGTENPFEAYKLEAGVNAKTLRDGVL